VAEASGANGRAVDAVVFDVDGTLIVHPSGLVVWQLLNHRFGTPAEINRERYRRVLAGELSYAEWVRLDIEDWRNAGARREQLVAMLREFELVPGAREALSTLRRRGYRLAAVSGTLDLLVDTIFPEHPFERLYCNRIWFADDGAIAGWSATPFDFDGKAKALAELARDTGVPVSRMAFVGDDVNDLDAARAVPLSFAFRPRSAALAEVCTVVLREGPLTQVLEHLP
jgi:HAD superfamily phosphoserine phosphatase-like hydrolase